MRRRSRRPKSAEGTIFSLCFFRGRFSYIRPARTQSVGRLKTQEFSNHEEPELKRDDEGARDDRARRDHLEQVRRRRPSRFVIVAYRKTASGLVVRKTGNVEKLRRQAKRAGTGCVCQASCAGFATAGFAARRPQAPARPIRAGRGFLSAGSSLRRRHSPHIAAPESVTGGGGDLDTFSAPSEMES